MSRAGDGRAALAGAVTRLSRLAPPWRRDEWREEWLAEIASSARPRSTAAVIGRSLGACVHLLWLWSREWSLNMIGSDIRFAVRSLVRRPAFSFTAIATLVLGIGATTAMFSIVNSLLLRPLPYRDPGRLVSIWPGVSFAPGGLAEAEDGRGVFEAVGAYSGWGMTITGDVQAEILKGARLTPSLLTVLGVQPVAGRLFAGDEDRAGKDAVVLVSERLAIRRFGSAGAGIGQSLTVNGARVEVVGVMPATFAFPDSRSDIWMPITVDPSRGDYNAAFATLLGRLAPGVSLETAQARMRAYATALREAAPKRFDERFLARAVIEPMHQRLVRDVRSPLLMLFASVGVLLVIACANVGILMLTRAAARRGEIAVRAAMGAERLRIVRQLLVESAVVAIIGGTGGVLLSVWLAGLAVPLVPPTLPHIAPATLDWRVLAFATVMIIASAMVFGLVPALQLANPDVRSLLSLSRGGDRPASGRHARTALVLAEIALATLLVISAALLGRSFWQVASVPLGFDPEPVLTLRVSVPGSDDSSSARLPAVFDDILARIEAAPGVTDAGAIQLLPLTPDNWNPGVSEEGIADADQYPDDVNWRIATPHYFAAMSIPLRRGRMLQPQDRASSAAVAVVNETFAARVFRGRDPIGRRIRTGFERPGEWVEVVGVVGDLRQHTLEEPARPEIYRPFAQHPIGSMRVMVRSAGLPDEIAPSVRAAIAAVDRNIALAEVEPMTRVVDRTLGNRRMPMLVAGVFAFVAMALGLVGITGVLSFDVAERRREIGIRLALGATPGGIERRVLARGLWLALTGVGGGAAGALVSARALRAMLFGLSPTDPLTIGVVATFVVIMMAATLGPARRAARVDPLLALRE